MHLLHGNVYNSVKCYEWVHYPGLILVPTKQILHLPGGGGCMVLMIHEKYLSCKLYERNDMCLLIYNA